MILHPLFRYIPVPPSQVLRISIFTYIFFTLNFKLQNYVGDNLTPKIFDRHREMQPSGIVSKFHPHN